MSSNLSRSATTLREELHLDDRIDATAIKKYETLLEKKWTTIGRLQKRILEQESQIANLQKELRLATPTSLARRTQDPNHWLPGSPARYTLQSHKDPVTSIAFHPTFSSLASSSEDCTIKIWDWEFGELERTIKAHTNAVLDVDFGGPKGGILLASCSSDLTIKLWDPSNEYQNIRTLLGHDHSVSAVRFISPSLPNILVSASRDKYIRVWDTLTGYCLKTIGGHLDRIRDISASFDGQWLLSGGNDTAGVMWDASTGDAKATFVGHENFIECCVFAPSASYGYLADMAGLKKPPQASSLAEFVATGSRDKTVKLWTIQGSLVKTLIGHDSWVRGLVFHPGGKYLISVGDDKTTRCWDLSQAGRLVKTLAGEHQHFVTCVRWAPAVQSDAPQVFGLHEAEGKGFSQKIDSGERGIRCVIATGSVDCTVRVFV